jgi:hypothetical protein
LLCPVLVATPVAPQAKEQLGKPAQILFCIQEREEEAWAEIKRVCDTVLGVQSQCLVAPNIGLVGRNADKMVRGGWSCGLSKAWWCDMASMV